VATLPSFASDPIYSLAVAEANKGYKQTQGNVLSQQGQQLLQLGNYGLAQSVYGNNWLTNPATNTFTPKATFGQFMGSHFAQGLQGLSAKKKKAAYDAWAKTHRTKTTTPGSAFTPYETNQLAAIQAASDPEGGTSTFAKIARQYQQQQEQMNNELNASNLFYSGFRGKELGRLGRERQFSESEALFGTQQGLNSLNDTLLAAQTQRRQALIAAAEAAYQRMLAQNLAA
jgi:hypothetical protein